MNSSEPRQLNSAQKAGFISLLVFALVTISFSFLQLRNTVYGRFIIRQETTSLNTAVYDENTRLQQIDTDQDGLNDYEELYLYSTSPYLADTDSDTRDDALEIREGTDPLCPTGKTCSESEFAIGATPSSTLASPLLGTATTPDEILLNSQLGGMGGDAIDAEAVVALLRDPVQLRQLILATGKISEEDLNRIDDATLVTMAEEMIKDYQTTTSTSASASVQP